MKGHHSKGLVLALAAFAAAGTGHSQQPPQPTDIAPINGEVYYLLNQLTGFQADIGSTVSVVQQARSFTSLSQRWALTSAPDGYWRIGNISNSLCLDGGSAGGQAPVAEIRGRVPPARGCTHAGRGAKGRESGACPVVQSACAAIDTQQWALSATTNGYYTIVNRGTGLAIDLSSGSTAAGESLVQTPLESAATQSQQWRLRPAFFRAVDNALLEKQEAARAAMGLPWWNDAGQTQDVLAMFKNHGVNMVRLRPSSAPPYRNVSQTGCTGNACYGETEAQDLDLARRARNLGISLELTLLFDGGSSNSVPPAWTGDSQLAQLQSDLYAYVKAEILAYRQAGVMPDLVAVGNEVDTGFLGSLGSPTGQSFGGFAALQTTAMQAIQDAAADVSAGPAIPAPLTCIHITPAWDLSQFFALANHFSIPYDAVCQSYYPLYHGPLTEAQAAASNPGNKPVEQDVLVNAVNNLSKPIFIIETGEHYENGFNANDPWYSPLSRALQRQFLLDLQAVQRALPNHLGMGMAYWDPAGVNIPSGSGGFLNGDNLPNAIYTWNGLTLFDNADPSGSTNTTAPTYSLLLPGIDALGGKLDPTLSYKFVNAANGLILSVFQASSAPGAALDAEPDNGGPSLSQQWRISSNNDGYFRIASLNPGANVLDNGGSAASGNAIVQSPAGSSQELEWDVVSAGRSYFQLANRASGLVLDIIGGQAVQEPKDNSATQQWQIVPVH